jgi:hypothetical protein
MAREEIDRLGLEAAKLSASSGGHGSVSVMADRINRAVIGAQGQRPEYDHSALGAPDSGLPGLSLADVDQAAAELSQETGISFDVITAAARARAADRDAQELAVALAAEANDLLSLGGGDGDVIGLAVSAEERHHLAETGEAMPDGSFPCHDAAHLAAAKSEYHKGNYAGHSKAAVKAHINKCAKRLGLPGLDDDDDHDEGDDTEGNLAASYPRHRLVRDGNGYTTVPLSMADRAARDLARGQGRQAELPVPQDELEIAQLAGAYPAFFGDTLELARKGLTHVFTEPDTMDAGQPRKGGKQRDDEIRRIMSEHPELFAPDHGRSGLEVSGRSYAPKSQAQKARDEARARRGPHGWHTNASADDPWADRDGPLTGPARGARGRTLMPSR